MPARPARAGIRWVTVGLLKLPAGAHTSQQWRIHALTRDFRLEDVWALPTPGAADDFPRLVRTMVAFDPARSSGAVAALFAIRSKLGQLLGWDDEAESGLGSRVPSLRERLPEELRDPLSVPGSERLAFSPLYLTDDECALEVANATVHAVLHLGWVPDGAGYRGQMAILVKPNGLLGRVYMAAIAPFRYLIVYPQMLRQIEREWESARP